VADDDGRIVGVGQLLQHSDGARELASVVVEPECRGYGLACRLIDGLLSGYNGRMHMLVDRPSQTTTNAGAFTWPTRGRDLAPCPASTGSAASSHRSAR
jgi:Acetyltransferase (GNAT) family